MHEHVSRHPTGIPVDAFHVCRHHRSSGSRDLTLDESDLRAELTIWLGLATSSQQGPWYKERHYDVQVPPANSDASANQWGA